MDKPQKTRDFSNGVGGVAVLNRRRERRELGRGSRPPLLLRKPVICPLIKELVVTLPTPPPTTVEGHCSPKNPGVWAEAPRKAKCSVGRSGSLMGLGLAYTLSTHHEKRWAG